MDAGDLRYFEAVARLGGMNRAAGELNTVQSNVTARIRALEAELGVELFRRHSRGVELTRAGERLLPYAGKVAWVLAEARRAVLDDATPGGPLVLGSLETTAAHRLAPIIARFGMDHPGVDLSLRIANHADLVRRVLAFELDGAFVCAPALHTDLVSETVFEEELVLAVGAGADPNAPLVASGCRIVVKGVGCAYRERLERYLLSLGVQDVSRLEFGTLEAIIGCVEAGLGLTMLPRSVLTPAALAGRLRLIELPRETAEVETVFIRRRDAVEFGALRAFLDHVRRAAAGAARAAAAA